jgi:hypothetical protein
VKFRNTGRKVRDSHRVAGFATAEAAVEFKHVLAHNDLKQTKTTNQLILLRRVHIFPSVPREM